MNWEIRIQGLVQGVGFRPFIYRLAVAQGLTGFVRNDPQGVFILVQGELQHLKDFMVAVDKHHLPNCQITQARIKEVECSPYHEFSIIPSVLDPKATALVVPDIATCKECLCEIGDPLNRRFQYPFTNCTQCGPRYSIVEKLPYDRPFTSMKSFQMCPQCQAEYEDPCDRRFHAQPNACPQCGPKVMWQDPEGNVLSCGTQALEDLVRHLKIGAIVAVKGLGGFHIMADATQDNVIHELRERKQRPHKPFALMCSDIAMIKEYGQVNEACAKLLSSPQAPIVLVPKKHSHSVLSGGIAPQNNFIGCMLPAMPLHHLLMHLMERPLIATSGNLADEPICIDNDEALVRLRGIADFFLMHDRPIARAVEDSVYQMVDGKPYPIRNARGIAIHAIPLGLDVDGILAVGAHQKNTIALGVDTTAMVSQHLGDLEHEVAMKTLEETKASLQTIYTAKIKKVVCDQHPDYGSTLFAETLGLPLLRVQHHRAHVASAIADNGIKGEVLGVCWDGLGWGDDGKIWGGEFFVCQGNDYIRCAHLQPFHLPGGERAIKSPQRTALGVLYALCLGKWEMFKDLPWIQRFASRDLTLMAHQCAHGVNAPLTTSMGRLFDAVSSLLGLCHEQSYEGQAAMYVEHCAVDDATSKVYPYALVREGGTHLIDWTPMIKAILHDVCDGVDKGKIAYQFHLTLSEIIVNIAVLFNQQQIVLTGGCFQNTLLTQLSIDVLRAKGLKPFWHTQVPPNDGGLSLGQIYLAAKAKHFSEKSGGERVCV